MKHIAFILFFCLFTLKVKAQDTLIFDDNNANFYSNKYYLYPKTKTFEHYFITDDGQLWYGKGKYQKKGTNTIFYFGDSGKIKPNEINFEFSSTPVDSVSFSIKNKNYDFIGIEFFIGNLFIESSWEGEIKIDKKKIKNYDFVSLGNIPLEKIEFRLPLVKNLSKVTIISHQKEYSVVHYESNFRRKAKMSKKHLVTKDFYHTSKRKNIKFTLQ